MLRSYLNDTDTYLCGPKPVASPNLGTLGFNVIGTKRVAGSQGRSQHNNRSKQPRVQKAKERRVLKP